MRSSSASSQNPGRDTQRRQRALIAAIFGLFILIAASCSFDPSTTTSDTTIANPNSTSVTSARQSVACQADTTKRDESGQTSPTRLVRSYPVRDGQQARLLYGRARGDGGDYGWAHIRDKHLYGIWQGGGPLTLFSQIGICTEGGVQDAIGQTFSKGERQRQNDRYLYTLPVEDLTLPLGTKSAPGYEILVVVGNDNTIITSYPRQFR